MNRKKRWIALLLSVVLTLPLAACGQSVNPSSEESSSATEIISDQTVSEPESENSEPEIIDPEPEESEVVGPHVLVAYFSQYEFLANNARAVDGISSASLAPGDVERVAEFVRDALEANLFQISAAEPYPSDYDEVTQRAIEEMGTRPELDRMVEDMDRYDAIYIAYPVWAGTFPMPVATFLESYDFSGKIIIPLRVYENSIGGEAREQMAELAPDAEVLEGYAISLLREHPTAEGIEAWLAEQGLLESVESESISE